MLASHASLRDDYLVSCPELEVAVQAASCRRCTRCPDDRGRVRRVGHRPGAGAGCRRRGPRDPRSVRGAWFRAAGHPPGRRRVLRVVAESVDRRVAGEHRAASTLRAVAEEKEPTKTEPTSGTPRRPASPSPPEPNDDLVTTRHTLRSGRRSLHYTATTGRVVLREEVYEDGAFTGHTAKAEMSLTAYTLDDADPATRPVTFAFNGGPGSSSVWLHMGLFGPRRVVMGDVGSLMPPPYDIVDNAETLLTADRPGLPRPGVDGLLARGQGRQAGDLPRLPGRHRVGRRADPAVDLPARTLDVAQAAGRRVLWHAAGRGTRRASAEPLRHVPQRARAHLVACST